MQRKGAKVASLVRVAAAIALTVPAQAPTVSLGPAVLARRQPDEPHTLDMEPPPAMICVQASHQVPPSRAIPFVRRRRRRQYEQDAWPALNAARHSSHKRQRTLLMYAAMEAKKPE
jgi:hypothetical protein